MSLFELLFIAAFILLPIMEGVLKQRRKRQGQSGAGNTGPGRPGPDRDGSEARTRQEEPQSAAEMLPDDLWELMTGERRRSGRRQQESGDSPWSMEPDVATDTAEADAGPEEPWVMDDEAQVPEPVSAEYTGPEAYSLETPAPPPVERTVPTAAARHRAFHELIDREQRPARRHLSPLMRALRRPAGLRQAVLLKEILGPPKGLE